VVGITGHALINITYKKLSNAVTHVFCRIDLVTVLLVDIRRKKNRLWIVGSCW
jgi:hypothetical protein